ncbi:MAG: hypothetical protein QM708_11855 [Propioniciclava sp.]|uniref:hypothetical protein n=1 Tax=Propioniciclava sp. TaxID=2038686 RepID=UPI0039E3D11A
MAFSVDEVNDALTAEPLSASEIPPILLDLLVKTGASPLSPVAALVRDALASPPLAEAQIADAVRGYQLLLDDVGDGLTLTAAGYLPPRIVEALFTQLGLDGRWIGKGNREDMTLPVLELRESATALGLLRKAKGKLTRTAAARRLSGNPSALMAHISSRLPLGKRHEADAGSVALLFVAAGRDWYSSLSDAAEIMGSIGWGVTNGRLDLALNESSRPTMSVVHSLAGRLTTPEHRAAVACTLLQPREQ